MKCLALCCHFASFSTLTTPPPALDDGEFGSIIFLSTFKCVSSHLGVSSFCVRLAQGVFPVLGETLSVFAPNVVGPLGCGT